MKRLFLLSVTILLLTGAAYSQKCQDIRFARGRTSTIVNGVTSRGYLCYRVRAKSGQSITMHLDSPDPKVKFSLRQDYYDADFTAQDVRDWEGETGDVDAYLVSIGGSKAARKFSLSVVIH